MLQVVGECLVLEVQFLEPGLHHVADRHDAQQPARVVGHGQMSDPSIGHRRHQVLDRVAGGAGHDVLRHDRPDRPAERRRASRVIRLGLGLGLEAVAQAGADASTLATVFCASSADGHNCHALCEQLAGDDRQISPTRFHNSVHNAVAGYWGIASHSMAPCQVIGAFDASFGAGLLDALSQVACDGQPVLLIAYDSEYPQPLHAKRDTPDCAGVALLLGSQRSAGSIASFRTSPCSLAADAMDDAALEALRGHIPAMRALPLLQRLAQGRTGPVVLDYLAPMQLKLDLRPC